MKLFIITLASVLGLTAHSQINYNVPTHFHGLFHGQLPSARSAGMGNTTVTHSGIATAMFNPASVSADSSRFSLHFNYATGDPVWPGSKFNYLGIAFRPVNRLAVALYNFNWVNKDPVFSTIIGGFNESSDKREQNLYGINVAYEVIPGLHLGLGGNKLVDKAYNDHKTADATVFSFGGIYDRKVQFIKKETFRNQNLRLAASFYNFTMKNKVTQRYMQYYHFRDLPIHLYTGAAYSFSLPLRFAPAGNWSVTRGRDKTADLQFHLQYRDVLAGSDPNNNSHEFNSHIAIGAEAQFFELLSLRIGYYNEKRPTGLQPDGDVWVTKNKSGFTWGYGVHLPVKQLTKGRLPVNAELNFVTAPLLSELGDNYTHPAVFNDKKFSFRTGLTLRYVD